MTSTVTTGSEFIANLVNDNDTSFTATPAGVTVEFTIKRFIFQLMLEKAITVISRHDPMPVLKCAQIHATPGRLQVRTTDSQRTIITTTEIVTTTVPGVAVLPARRMLDIVKVGHDGEIHIRVSANTAHITIGPTTYRLSLLPGDDFPALPSIGDTTQVTVERAAFIANLNAVRYAASQDAERAPLAMVDITNGKMTASDGSRLQQTTIDTLPFNLQVPIDAVDDLLKLLKGTALDAISVGESTNHLIFTMGTDVFIVAKFTTPFPNSERMLLRPALANRYELTVDRDALAEAIKRVRITADTKTFAIALRLAPGTLTVAARDIHNEAQETIPAGWTGPPRALAVNHTFLTDMLAGYTRKDCSFWLGDDTPKHKAPLLLKDVHAGTVGVVQQMHIDWVGAT